MSSQRLWQVYRRLLDHYGPQGWWPSESQLETVVGAILTQNTSWTRVEAAIGNLKEQEMLDLPRLLDARQDELSELIRPAGYFRLKAQRLGNLLNLIRDSHEGSLESLLSLPAPQLREQLLSVKGIGPETADAIILYAAEYPQFVVDTYTHRVFARHGWVEWDIDYHTLQEHFTSSLEDDVQMFNEYHALLVTVGNGHCRARPRCEGCPLQDLLPEGGVCLPEQ